MPKRGDFSGREHPLDRRGARVVALCVCAVMLGLLGYIHREDLILGAVSEADSADSAFAVCLAERYGAVDQMIADGVVGDDRATLFKSRAEALCRSTNPE